MNSRCLSSNYLVWGKNYFMDEKFLLHRTWPQHAFPKTWLRPNT
jgi:hypothetical protein